MWSAAKYFGVPAAARDDVVQDVFLTAYRRFDQVHYQVSARAWLYGVTRRVASHWHRGVARRTRRIAALGDLTGHVGEAPQERHDAARLLERLLAGLPRGTREVWELTELLGMSGPEIAAELELPLNTVYSRLRLARARLLELAASPELLAVEVAESRRRDEPPEGAASRTWAVMVPLFGHGKLATVAAAWTTARAGVMTTLVVAGATAVVAVAPRQAPGRAAAAQIEDLSAKTAGSRSSGDMSRETAKPSPDDMSRETATPSSDDMSRETASISPTEAPATALRSPVSPVSFAHLRAQVAGVWTRATAPLSPGPAAGLSPRTAAPAPAGRVTRPAYDQLLSRETSTRLPARDDLALEVGLLDRARARLDARDPAGAAQLLDAHARQFPRGALVDAREAAAVELLCLQGRPADAATAAQRLAARLPDSVLARRFERFVCPDDEPR
ncbi:RNA polymerase sigma factor [Nannocystis pusilla]|uniref:RNA polymerase sigma factor n=1 Tax=Nannocystis pusilla TaxID=889268 RepID=UPI003DA39CD5